MIIKQLKNILITSVLSLFILLNITISHAQQTNVGGGTGNYPACGILDLRKIKDQKVLDACREACSDPDYQYYNSTQCTDLLLGIVEIDTNGILIKQNPTQFIIILFQFFLAIVIIIVVYRIVIAGLTVTNAGAESDKRTDGFKKLVNASIGLVLSFSSLGVTNLVKSVFIGKSNEQLLRGCEDLRNQGADISVIEDCEILKN